MKRWWEVTDKDIDAMLGSTEWASANRGYFRGGGYSSSFSTKGEMPVTLVRVNLVEGIGYVLQLAEGWTVELPEEVNKTLLYRTDRTCLLYTSRNKNFQEVALGYTAETAVEEAQRCLNCKHKPCIGGCPVKIHIPDFIAKVAAGEFEAAYQIIQQTSSLPAVCGRVCPQETQCEQKCVRGIKGCLLYTSRCV